MNIHLPPPQKKNPLFYRWRRCQFVQNNYSNSTALHLTILPSTHCYHSANNSQSLPKTTTVWSPICPLTYQFKDEQKTKKDCSYLILRSTENTSLIRSGEWGASNVCVCRHSWATSPLARIDYFICHMQILHKEYLSRPFLIMGKSCSYRDHQTCYTSPWFWNGLCHMPLPVLM